METANGNGHGDKQGRLAEALIAALLTEPTVQAAAAAVGIGETTAWRWMKGRAFQRRYRKARARVVEAAVGRLQKAATAAVDTLTAALACDDPAVRVRAATAILDRALRAADVVDAAARLDAIEARLDHQPKTT